MRVELTSTFIPVVSCQEVSVALRYALRDARCLDDLALAVEAILEELEPPGPRGADLYVGSVIIDPAMGMKGDG